MFADTMLEVSHWGHAFAPDTPGYGQSTPLSGQVDVPSLARQLIKAIRIWSQDQKVIVCGVHTGASLAVEIAHQAPELCEGVYLVGLPSYSEEVREERLKTYAPGIEIQESGAHLAWAWDRYVKMWPTATLDQVQLATADIIYSLERYNTGYLAAFKYLADEVLATLKCPVTLSAAENEFLYESNKALATQLGIKFHAFPGIDWQGQVPLRNPAELGHELKNFAAEVLGN
jgi:pimeloyl-ACP methyl ester carboxylesterase